MNIPEPIIMNLPEHFNDILGELIEENKINGKIEGNILLLF